MTNENLEKKDDIKINAQIVSDVVLRGDLRSLSPEQKVSFYNKTCESLGLNPLTQPLDYIVLNNKEKLYAKKDCTDQLRKIHSISITIVAREKIEDIYQVIARAATPSGRTDESCGAVSVGNLRGDPLANAIMKAETKAKRRATLSICGLGFLDETELETIDELKRKVVQAQQVAPISRETKVVEKPADQAPAVEQKEEINFDKETENFVLRIAEAKTKKAMAEIAGDIRDLKKRGLPEDSRKALLAAYSERKKQLGIV